jgi:hypothetical protein
MMHEFITEVQDVFTKRAATMGAWIEFMIELTSVMPI